MEKENCKKAKESACSHISYDLLLEILCRLPVKSLRRFKCVSKSWCSLIQNPFFIDKARPKTPLKWVDDFEGEFRIYSTDENGFTTHMKTHKFDENIWSVRYCNGLVCFYGDGDYFAEGDDDIHLWVFNLTTEVLAYLPPLCDNIEFGFDPMSMKYKVLGLTRSSGFQILTVEERCSWRLVTNTLGIRSLGSSVTVDGRLFWPDNEARIISFNLANEEFGIIELPDMINKKDFQYSLIEFEGLLCWIEQPQCEQERCHLEIVNLWLLKDIENNVWVKVLKNIIPPLEGTTLQDYFWGVGLHYSPKDSEFLSRSGEILIVAPDHTTQYIIFYSFLSCEFKRIKIRQLDSLGVSINKYVDNYEFL